MTSVWLAEATVNAITAQIKANIAGALADVRTDRADPICTTEPPKKYFIFEPAKGYETLAVFVVCEEFHMRNAEKQSNMLAASARVVVSVLVENRDRTHLTVKAWRYQAALHKVLHLSSLTTASNKVKLVVRVGSTLFSPDFSETQDPKAPGSVFRREVALVLDVEHYENL